MGFDTKCYDLAEAFLEDEKFLNNPQSYKSLAQVIQDAIESWINAAKEDEHD